MKKYFKLLLSLLLFIPLCVFASDEAYDYFDFKVERVNGANIKNTDIKIFASLESDPTNLTDRTDEFNLDEVMWSVCTESDCSLSEEVSDEALFEGGKEYILLVRITAKNESDINVWGTDKVKYNGIPIEELSGEFSNSGKELMIKTKTNAVEVVLTNNNPEEPLVIAPNPNIQKSCMFNYSFCCITLLNISICIWLLILLVLIILIVVIACIKKSKRKNQGYY